MIVWHWKSFPQLNTRELYMILKARQEVFAVEQDCAYLDLDDLDYQSWHLYTLTDDAQIAAYLRLVKPGKRFPEPSVGRVLTSRDLRGKGMGRALMQEGIRRAIAEFPGLGMRISAQQYLQAFYASLGFVAVGEAYQEDGIPHIEMFWSGA